MTSSNDPRIICPTSRPRDLIYKSSTLVFALVWHRQECNGMPRRQGMVWPSAAINYEFWPKEVNSLQHESYSLLRLILPCCYTLFKFLFSWLNIMVPTLRTVLVALGFVFSAAVNASPSMLIGEREAQQVGDCKWPLDCESIINEKYLLTMHRHCLVFTSTPSSSRDLHRRRQFAPRAWLGHLSQTEPCDSPLLRQHADRSEGVHSSYSTEWLSEAAGK